MDMIFDNPLRETFKGKRVGPGIRGQEAGSKLDYIPSVRKNTLNGNMQNNSAGFLAANSQPNYIVHSDDEPLHFSFPF